MKKKFFINLIFVLALNFIVKPIWIFGIDRKIQNIVGVENYGFYFSLFSFSLIFNMILDIGLTNYNNRNIAQNNKLLSSYFSNIIVLKFLLGFAYFVIIIISSLLIDYSNKQIKLLLLLAFNQFLLSFIFYFRSNISGLHFFKTDSIISILDKSILIILCSIILSYNTYRFKIECLVYLQSISYIITFIVAFVINYKKTNKILFKFNIKRIIIISKQSFPYAVLFLLMSIYMRIDSVMIERLLSDGKIYAGIYAQAYRLIDALSVIPFLFAGLLLPIFSSMIKSNKNIDDLIKFSFNILLIPTIILLIPIIVYSENIMDILYIKYQSISAKILIVLIIGFIPISSNYIFGTLLTANGSLKKLNSIAILSVTINIILNYFLIKNMFALGAALASVITNLFSAILQFIVAKQIFKIKINYKQVIKIILFLVLYIIIALVLKNKIDNWLYEAIVLIFIGCIILLSTNIIDIGKIKYIKSIISNQKL